MITLSPRARAVAAAAAVFALGTAAASAQSVNVTLNGSPLTLSPGPETRDGRVFVPLRGVFERLGASVVYNDGTINAQGNNHSVSLHIGSTQATVDGQQQMLDVAPFIIGASTYVPLRFVSQALGANVDYDASNRIVALSQNGPPPNFSSQNDRPRDDQPRDNPPREGQPPMQPQAPQRSALAFRDERPAGDASVESRRPTIEAQFGGVQADPNSVRVMLDGLDVTAQASRSPEGIVFSPPSDLQSQRHEVRVSGRDVNGAPFEGAWTFTSGTAIARNTISDLTPGDGDVVGRQFVVRGHSMPNARIVVQVGTVNAPSNVLGQLFNGGPANSNVRSEVTADGNGMFSAPVTIDAHAGQALTLVVDSTDARTQSSAPRAVRNLTLQ
jgi:hypothetical protein